MSPEQLQSLIPQLLDITQRAGEEILKVYRTEFDVRYKDDKSPVTEADMAAHHLILSSLKALTPDIPVLSEESAHVPWSERRQWTTYWLVDPLDGTREFLNRSGEFTVNIALIHDHQPALGVVGVPVTGDLYWGGETLGAWRKDSEGQIVKLEVAERPPKLRVLASKNHLNAATTAYIDKLGPIELLQAGSSLKICRIAEGKADLYPRLGPTAEWDIGAAHAVLLAAGGSVKTEEGEPLRYNTKEDLINAGFVASAR